MNLIWQIARYSIVGSMAALTQYITVVLIVEAFNLNPVYANVVGYLCGFVVSLIGHHVWTFANTDRPISLIVPQFMLAAGLNFCINRTVFFVTFRHLGLHYTTALYLAIITAVSVTFLVNKFWVFQE